MRQARSGFTLGRAAPLWSRWLFVDQGSRNQRRRDQDEGGFRAPGNHQDQYCARDTELSHPGGETYGDASVEYRGGGGKRQQEASAERGDAWRRHDRRQQG